MNSTARSNGPSPQSAATRSTAADLFDRILKRDPRAELELYRLIGRAIASKWASTDPDRDDGHHDVFMAVIRAIRTRALREPSALLAYVRTVIRRRHVERIAILVRERQLEEIHPDVAPDGTDLDEELYLNAQRRLLNRGLKMLSSRDHQILVRFYIIEQGRDEIMTEMGLDETRYRVMKSRAKQRLTDKVRSFATFRDRLKPGAQS